MADPGGRRAALFWARVDVRGRWRSLVLLGVLIGVSVITEQVPLAYIAPLAVLGVLLIIPATILLANSLSMWPGQLVARTHLPSRELRAE